IQMIQQAIGQADQKTKEGMAQKYSILAQAAEKATPENYGALSAAVRQAMPDLQIPATWEEFQAAKPQMEATMAVMAGELGMTPQAPEEYTLAPGAQRFRGGEAIAANTTPDPMQSANVT